MYESQVISEKGIMHSRILELEQANAELLQALKEAKDQLIDLGMEEDSVGIAGMKEVIRRNENN